MRIRLPRGRLQCLLVFVLDRLTTPSSSSSTSPFTMMVDGDSEKQVIMVESRDWRRQSRPPDEKEEVAMGGNDGLDREAEGMCGER